MTDKMSAYMIANYDVKDEDAHLRYIQAADPLLVKHGGEIIVADVAAQTIEGNGGTVGVVVKFPSQEAALAFYNDPDYQAVKPIRLASTKNATVVLAHAGEAQ